MVSSHRSAPVTGPALANLLPVLHRADRHPRGPGVSQVTVFGGASGAATPRVAAWVWNGRSGPPGSRHVQKHVPGWILAAFLAGDVDPAAAWRWDEHLLACETCRRAVREDRAARRAAVLLRQPAPPGLADGVAAAVEAAAAGHTAGRRRARRGPAAEC
jgi:hypothetical protein